MVFYWKLSDNKLFFFQVSWTLLTDLADLKNAVVWMISVRPLISKSSRLCSNPLVTVPSVLITIRVTVTFMFHSFLARSRYLDFFPLFFLRFSICTSFCSIWPIEWTWEQWLWRGTPHSPNLQHYWSLTIRLLVSYEDISWSSPTPLHLIDRVKNNFWALDVESMSKLYFVVKVKQCNTEGIEFWTNTTCFYLFWKIFR